MRYRRKALLRARADVTDTVHINTRIRQNAETLAAALEGHMHKIFAPDARKELRLFSAGEAAERGITFHIATQLLKLDHHIIGVQFQFL